MVTSYTGPLFLCLNDISMMIDCVIFLAIYLFANMFYLDVVSGCCNSLCIRS